MQRKFVLEILNETSFAGAKVFFCAASKVVSKTQAMPAWRMCTRNFTCFLIGLLSETHQVPMNGSAARNPLRIKKQRMSSVEVLPRFTGFLSQFEKSASHGCVI